MRVIVVGAGFAGLAAADALATAGVDVLVFEARDRVGGRVWSQELPTGGVVEMGAEFILPDNRVIRETAARLGLALFDKGTTYGDREPRGGLPVTRQELVAAYGAVREAAAHGRLGHGTVVDALAVDPDGRRRAGRHPGPDRGVDRVPGRRPGRRRPPRGRDERRRLRHALGRGRQPADRPRARGAAGGSGATRDARHADRLRPGRRPRDRGRLARRGGRGRCLGPGLGHRPDLVRPAAPRSEGRGAGRGPLRHRGEAVPPPRPGDGPERDPVRPRPLLDVHPARARRRPAARRRVVRRVAARPRAAGHRRGTGHLDRVRRRTSGQTSRSVPTKP